MDMFREVVRLQDERREGVLVTVIDLQGEGPSVVGKKMLITADGEKLGTVGGGELERLASVKAAALLSSRTHQIESYNLSGGAAGPTQPTGMICGGIVTLFFEYIPARPRLYVFGAGNVGRCVLYHLRNMDYDITVFEERTEAAVGLEGVGRVMIGDYTETVGSERAPDGSYVVIAAFSHERDYQVLRSIFRAQWKPAYIGLLASPAKAESIVRKLIDELGDGLDLGVLYSSVGLDIGGESPDEIAVSIISEIQALRYHRLGNRHLSRPWSTSLPAK